MPAISFTHPDGSRETIEAPAGESVMDAAFDAEVDGLLGECGGNAMCGTCHVFVLSPPVTSLPALGVAEAAMLDTTATDRRLNSRLSCQLIVDDALEGAEFEIPATQ